MKTITVDVTVRLTMSIPDLMEAGEAVSEMNYSFDGDEDDLISITDTEIVDFEEINTARHTRHQQNDAEYDTPLLPI